ncbi:MAG: hypothetical protein JEZ11_15575 [Desulfobacterales bacterium]|nr:hypothetical protein [Desulfobacterales bacterium]
MMQTPIKLSFLAVLLLVFSCDGGPNNSRSGVPRGYVSVLRMVESGYQINFGPFVGYYFKPENPNDLSRLTFVCLNERQFYTKDLPAGALLYDGEAVRTTLPAAASPPVSGSDRMVPVFGDQIPQAWRATRPVPQEEFVHFHSGYDAAGPVFTGYWLRHRAVAAFTYDMGGRVGPESPLFHRVTPGPDLNFPRIVEFDAGPSK